MISFPGAAGGKGDGACPRLDDDRCGAVQITQSYKIKGNKPHEISGRKFAKEYCSHAGRTCALYESTQARVTDVYERVIGQLADATEVGAIQQGILTLSEMATACKTSRPHQGRRNGNGVETGLLVASGGITERYGASIPMGISYHILSTCNCERKHQVAKSGAYCHMAPRTDGEKDVMLFGISSPIEMRGRIIPIEAGGIPVFEFRRKEPYCRSVRINEPIELTGDEKQLIERGTVTETEMNDALECARFLQEAYRAVHD